MRLTKLALIPLIILTSSVNAFPQTSQSRLQTVVDAAVAETIKRFNNKKLLPEQLAVTVIDLTESHPRASANYRGEEPIYPASVVKLFYLTAVEQWLADRKLQDTAELRRALRDMIVDSSNDATHYVVDVLTQTTGGFELPPEEMKGWQDKRNVVNRYFASLGFTNINVNQKTYCEDVYGRENVSRGPNGENRNKLTTNATARLLADIATGKAVSANRSHEMMLLLARDPAKRSGDGDSEDNGFTGTALPAGARLWSKAGWTSTVRHDAAYIELPAGQKLVLVIFTTDHYNDREIIPAFARSIIDGLRN